MSGSPLPYHLQMHPTPNHPLDALWQAPAIVWSILAGECLALVLALSPGLLESRLVVFGLASFLIQWIILLTLGTLYGLRRPIRRLSPYQLALLALLIMLISNWVVTGTARAFVAPALLGNETTWLLPMIRVTGIALAVGVLGLAAFHNHWRARQAAVRAKQAELEALQARTHPHFLFNSLNTAIALLHQRPDDAERVLLDLSDLFRSALAGPRFISLEEELDLAVRYLEIERLRLGERLQVEWELPETLPPIELPALSVQPLVENAVRHGIEGNLEGGRIDIRIILADDLLQVTVCNDLPATAPTCTGQGHGVGLPSVASRIEAMTAGRGSLTTAVRNGRYVATISIPVAPPPR